jgi:hypothetical protein
MSLGGLDKKLLVLAPRQSPSRSVVRMSVSTTRPTW